MGGGHSPRGGQGRWLTFLVGLCMGVIGCGAGSTVSPREFESLTIYCYEPPDPLQLPTVPHVQLGVKRTRRLLANCEHHRRWVLWKTCYLAVARTADGRGVTLFISKYGSFFAIEDQKGFWALEGPSRDEWKRVLDVASVRVFQKPLFEPLKAQQDANLRLVKIGDRYGYLDRAGLVAIQPRFDDAMPFSEGLAAVRVGNPDEGKWGYIDTSGRFVIEPRFAGASFFSEGLAAVTVDDFFYGKQGYINRQGEMVIEPQFDGAWPFVDGVAVVWLDRRSESGQRSHWINKGGEPITSREFLKARHPDIR